MATSEVLHTHPTNGHINYAGDSDLRGLEHEDTTSMSAIESADRPEQDVSEAGLEEAHTERHEQPRSAQPEGTVTSPVLDNPPAGQPVAPSSKDKPADSPTKRPVTTVQTTIGKAAVSGPPTPQVKKILNSGKFGTGVTKAVPPPISKTTLTSPITGKTSLVPPKPAAPPARSSTLSASTSGKLSSATPSSTTVKPPSTAPSRPSAVSPDSTVSAKSAATPRPRASVSESTVPRKAPAPRASLTPSTKPPTTTTARSSRAPGPGSISSLKDVKEAKEDGAALVELQNKVPNSPHLNKTKNSDFVEQLEAAKTTTTEQNTLIETLREQIDTLQAEVDETKGTLEALHIAAAAEIDRQALVKARADLEAKLDAAAASHAESLTAEIETSNKLSELEAQELAEEEHKASEATINTLPEATNKAASAAAEYLEKALALAVEESRKLTEQLSASQAELDKLPSAAEEHARLLAEAEEAHQARQDELTAEIGKISAELEAQEALYNAKVQTVKDEHDQLLQQAFERAKDEAGEAHGQDLQTLRENSEVAIEQLRSSHQTTVDGLKTDHEAELASQAQTYQKQLSSQSLELKATSEDLAKAKATLGTSLQEVEALKAQLDETRQAAQTAANAAATDKDADIARLTKDVSNARDELSTLNEALRITQESMQEMGKNHQMELEEVATGRADEVSKLRAAHDAEIQSLVADKSGLVTRLSDLEGELLTARASAAPTEAIASPKRNGLSTTPVETVTKEELQRMHEAHNLKINDLQAQHDKAIRALQEQAEQDLDRKKMEIMLLEQDQEETQDQITRYVKLFGFKSFLLAVIIGSGLF
ncbi:hypothetical protein BJV78DRAFT_1272599 [Lactifluus subvellereus]|nr:hypothetical protein BJV78DRAFT_1272599 [Lactifluus subvellereus]